MLQFAFAVSIIAVLAVPAAKAQAHTNARSCLKLYPQQYCRWMYRMKKQHTIALIGFDWVQQFPVLDYGGIEKMVEDQATAMHHFGRCLPEI